MGSYDKSLTPRTASREGDAEKGRRQLPITSIEHRDRFCNLQSSDEKSKTSQITDVMGLCYAGNDHWRVREL